MNYRHVYHAGNFADVLKHLTLALVIEHLKLKPAPFRVIDTHAGTGLYDLSSEEAAKTGEWRTGIGRLIGRPAPAEVADVLAPYLSAVHPSLVAPVALTGAPVDGQVLEYPGSPFIARRLMRPGDVLVANELHPEDRVALETLFQRDKSVKVMGLDGWTAIRSLLPPKERRGLVLIDPPFEEPGEFHRIIAGLEDGLARFAHGTYLIWYPIKDVKAVRNFYAGLDRLRIADRIVIELSLRAMDEEPGLAATGLVVVNPPYMLKDHLETVMPWLVSALERRPRSGRWRVSQNFTADGQITSA
ncbi:MAG: 23S rRNA (adenine(2030)-N(6))-methyltransferase RlmJ [Hyphomicrobium sp.]|nr:23S rRNA (adenine(2030)-N(6))-methyltransferase RlmJ [Hyphomicrobium sp.]